MAILEAGIAEAINNSSTETTYTPIPAGDYTLQVEETSIETTRSGDGQYVKTTLVVLGPSYQGRKIFTNFNIRNRSTRAEEIGRAQLKVLSTACGITDLRDTDQLVGKVVVANVTVEPGKGQYSDQNRVGKYRPTGSVGGSVGGTKQTAAQQPLPADQDMPSGNAFSTSFAGAQQTTANWFK